ncbi:Retrovirus-related Pol polyprotein, partial [Mucuna pruriens]
MEDEEPKEGSALILERPFSMTAKTKIDVHAETFLMEFGDTYMTFNIFEALKHPTKDHSIFSIDTIDGLMDDYFRLGTGSANLADFVNISYIISPQPANATLKPLPKHLKYAYLGDSQQFPVIIANNLNREQEEKLLEILKKQKRGIGWALVDILGINPSICMQKILLEEDARLDHLSISDSQWVSLVQVFPKKSGMTVIKNRQDEMNRWRVCIDYRKLNQVTHKDHFSLSFIDQVLEKLAGYKQTHIALVDQYKTSFTCSFETFIYIRMSFRLYNASIYVKSFEACLDNLSKVLHRCIYSNLVLKFEKLHFKVTKGIILGHLVSARGIEVDKAKIDVIYSLPNPTSMQEVRSFLGHANRPTSIQAAIEGRQLHLRSTLCGRISRAEEKTHVYAHTPSTKLGTIVRANVRRL